MTETWRFKDEWLLRALAGLKEVIQPFIATMREGKKPYLSHALIDAGLFTAEQLGKVVEVTLKVKYLPLGPDSADKFGVNLLSEKVCRKYNVVPVQVTEEEIRLAMDNPLNFDAQSDVEAITARRVIPLFALPHAVEACLGQLFSADKVIYELLTQVEPAEDVQILGRSYAPKIDDDTEVTAPVVALANSIISQAHRRRASDIHIEHEEAGSHVRIRVDGVLKNIMNIPRRLAAGPLVSRIKIMADLDVSDHMRPQDGRTKIRIAGAEVGLRVSTLPTSYGEKVVIRILDQRVAEVPLEKLGFAPEVSSIIKASLSASQGMLLITGPTGSGKTTTLYSMLDKARHEGTNIVTVEDPIEYKLAGINQVQVNEKQGLTFASVLRSVLRQDPDIIMVGEVRDRETADIAFQAAMTGHLVFSTLHTNDTVSTIARLSDMGVDRFKIAPSMLAITAQRLVRKLCPVCAERVPAGELDKAVLGAMTAYGLDPVAYRARGCKNCDNSGYEGRTALVEILNMTQYLKELISSGARAAEISRAAVESNALRTITKDALWHLSKGHTDLKEITPHLLLTGPEFQAPRPHAAAPHVFQERRKAQPPLPQAEPARTAEHAPAPAPRAHAPAPRPAQEQPQKQEPHHAPARPAAHTPAPAAHTAPEHPRKHAPAQPPHAAPEREKRHAQPPAPHAGHERRKHQAPHTGHERRKTAAHPPAQHAAPKPAPPQRKLRVMIAEDNDLMRMLLKKFLEDAGFEPILAADGEEALTAIASGIQPDILVSDLNMPRMNGFELVKGVRESMGIKDMPILILTSNNTNKSQELAFRMGADDYICKPFNAPLFISRIHAALLRADRIK